MSPFRFALRIAGFALLITTTAPGQTADLDDAATAAQITIEDGRAETAPALVEYAPQESRALGSPSGLIGPRRGGGGELPDERRGLDPRVNEIVRVGGALGAVVGLLLVLRLVLRRLGGPLTGGGRPSGVVEVLARYPVARGQQLVLLKMGSRVVLLHQTKTGMTTLSEVADPDEVAALMARVESSDSRRGKAAGFSTLLDRLLVPAREAGDDEFTRTLGASREIEGKVVVDLTRRPRRRRKLARGGGR
jgi:flagellar biogenesis protein FliO